MSAKRYIFNDENKKNSYGFRVLTAGINTTDRFDANPVCLNNHSNHTSDVLGKWKDYKKDKGILSGVPVFDTEDEKGKEVVRKVLNGTIVSVSMAFFFDPEDLIYINNELVLQKCELTEVSFVALPSNANAVVLYNRTTGNQYTEQEIKQLCLSAQTQSENQNQNYTMKKVIAHLQLAENANETQVLEAVQAVEAKLTAKSNEFMELKAKYDGMVAEQTAKLKADFDAELAIAEKDGRIDNKAKETFEQMALSAGYDKGLEVLKALPKRDTIADKLKGKEGQLTAYDKMSWEDLDKGNHLATLKADFPDYFAERYKQKFNKEPK